MANLPKLSAREKVFVEAYCTTADFNATKAYREAVPNASRNAGKLAHKMLLKPSVARAIENRLDSKRRVFRIREDQILEGLYAEATNENARPSERIQAWVHLGKHLGMFREKQEEKDTQITYNIVNYNGTNKKIEEATEKAVAALSHEQIEEAEAE